MYAKCGRLDDAVSVFENMSVIDTQAWSAMIMACMVLKPYHCLKK